MSKCHLIGVLLNYPCSFQCCYFIIFCHAYLAYRRAECRRRLLSAICAHVLLLVYEHACSFITRDDRNRNAANIIHTEAFFWPRRRLLGNVFIAASEHDESNQSRIGLCRVVTKRLPASNRIGYMPICECILAPRRRTLTDRFTANHIISLNWRRLRKLRLSNGK